MLPFSTGARCRFGSTFTAGYRIEIFGGYWIKPISNAQIDAQWSAEMLDAFMRLGERYPDIAAEIYVVASPDGASRSKS